MDEPICRASLKTPTQWAWVWVNSGRWWWTGGLACCCPWGSLRVRHGWATELNWTGDWRHRCRDSTCESPTWGEQRVGWTERWAVWKHMDYHMWNRWPVRICSVAQGTHTGDLWKTLEGWEVGGTCKTEGTCASLWLIHVEVWQNPTQYCQAIILQLKTHYKL